MAFINRLLAPIRWTFAAERPASLSLGEGTRPGTSEIGSNSVSYSRTGQLYDREYKYELRGPQGGRTYQRMRRSDPHIAGLRAAQNLPMMQASVKILSADPKDPDARAKAELVKRLLLRDFPWRSFLQDTFLALDYGFACFEIVWRLEGGEARCRLALRPSSSIDTGDIYVKDGAIDHIVQRPFDGGEKTIPGEKLVWFAHEKEGDSFQGQPILRAMYKPWKIKEELEIELPIMIRKLGGIPDITTDGQPTTEEAAKLDLAGAAFGIAPDAYFRHLDTTKVELLTGKANVSDVLAAIQQRNTEITSVCQAQVFDLGTSQAGSRALGTTLADLFTNGIQAQAKQREDVLNACGGLIHQLVDYNFPRDDNLPQLKFGAVQQVDLKSFATALVAFATAFRTLDPETQEWAREESGMPVDVTAQIVVPGKPEPPAPASSKSQGPGADAAGGSGQGEPDPAEIGAKAAECGHNHNLRLAERRDPHGVECFVALAEVDQRFTDAKTAVREATQAIRDRLVAELIRRAEEAQKSGRLSQFAAGVAPMVDVLTSEVRRVLADFYTFGRQQVTEELDRQRAGKPVVEDVVQARQEGKPIVAVEKPRKKNARAPVPDPEAALDIQAEVVAKGIADQTKAAAAAAAARVAAGTPLTPSAWATMVGRASDDAALRLGLTVSDAMILGRSVVAGERAYEIEQGVYSALLDDAVCSACETQDGETTTDLGEAEGWTPNPDCEGGLYCRCLVVYELNPDYQEAAA